MTDESRSQGASEFDHEPNVVFAVKRYMALLETGDAPSLADFCREYPEIADELRPCLDGLALVTRGMGQRNVHADSVRTDPAASQAPSALGDFRIVHEIGRGGMGIVYEAMQLSLGRRVALKVLSFASSLDAVRLQRFRNEAQAAAQLHHPHIVPVYAVGSDRGVHYYAMQLIEGPSLAQVIESIKRSRTGSPEPSLFKPQELGAADSLSETKDSNRQRHQQANTIQGMDLDSTHPSNPRNHRVRYFRSLAKMILQAAQGLEHAHRYGVVHRDVKPGNMMLDSTGNVLITDFGLAQMQSDSDLTRTGDMLGTLRYMSPEQTTGGLLPVDHRTDIYSLGATFYELITLQPAVTGTGYQEITHQITDIDPASPRSIDPTIPAELEIIALKAMSKNPIDRYTTAGKLADDLQRWMEDKPILAKPPNLFQRLAKWRRRHAGLVTAGMVFAVLAGIGLLVTTIAVVREQSKTQTALRNETSQRIAAEISFRQARRAVDTFSSLSETELANRPDLKSLRREFLEASLEFYRDFIELRGDESALRDELSATKERVENLVEALKRMDRTGPLRLLAYETVQQEIGLPAEQAWAIEAMLEQLEIESDNVEADDPNSFESAEIVKKYERIASQLSESQWTRLHQIHRQSRLPFTFKSIEIVEKLKLTLEQRSNIGLIIEEERPDRAARRLGINTAPDFDGRPPRDLGMGPPPDGGRFRQRGNRGDKPMHNPDFRGKPPRDMGGPPPGRRPKRTKEDKELFESQTKKTVERIVASLTPMQKKTWEELIGKPFPIDFE